MRKSLLYRILLVILTICFTFSFVACKKPTSESKTSEKETVSETETGSDPISNSEQESESESQPQSESKTETESESVINPDEPLVDFVVEVEEGRDIRVMQITDVQTIDGSQQRYQARIGTAWVGSGGPVVRYHNQIRQVVEKYDPDLIVMTGDNVYGEFDDAGTSLMDLINFMDSLQVPWAPIMGNHDVETNLGADWQCEQYEKSEYCLFKQRELTGNGNYTVGLSQGGVLKRVFYMLDSNGSGNISLASRANGHTVTYQGFGQDQIDWYTDSATRLKKESPETKISFCFHIPIMAFKDAAVKYGYSTEAIKTQGIDLDKLGEEGTIGVINNAFSPWDGDYKVWNGLKSLGVDSIFVGHEHRNSFSVMYEGVRLTFGQKSSTYDTINYRLPDGSVVGNKVGGQGDAIIGGTCIPVSSKNGEIVNPYILTYDEKDPNFVPEVDTSDIRVPTVDNVSDSIGSYRGNEFKRYTLSELGITAGTSIKSGFSINMGEEESFSIRFKIKTASTIGSSKVNFYFYTAEKKRSVFSQSFMATRANVADQTVNASFAGNKEYEIEVGIVKLYEGKTAYMFMKIDGVLSNRWILQEVTEDTVLGNFVYVVGSGATEFGTIL